MIRSKTLADEALSAYTNGKEFAYDHIQRGEVVNFNGSGTRLVNTKDGVQLELERNSSGSGNVNCHIYVISDAQMNILGRQLESVQY